MRKLPNNTATITPALSAARNYAGRGWYPIPLPHRGKAPVGKDWVNLRIGAQDVPRHFKGRVNVGVILGEPSGDLVDADLDCPEALALAPSFLPDTDAVFGRRGKPRSHWLYISPGASTKELKDPETTTMLVELRSTGGQTVFPGSTHESGQAIEWADNGDPAGVDAEQLIAAVRRLATACLLVRAAPAEGRHDYLLQIAGVLVRGLGRDGAAEIHHPVARAILGDLHKKADGDRLLDDTERKLEAGEPIPGVPKLIEAIGEKRARKVIDWLSIKTSAIERPAWYGKLIRGRHEPYDNIANVVTALTSDPAFAGQVAYDEMLAAVVARELPWKSSDAWRAWRDTDDTALAQWCQQRGLNARVSTCAGAVQLFAGDNPIHPLRDHLNALVWDGRERLNRFLVDYFGAKDTPFNREAGQAWMVSAVARAFEPGCKADHILILEAPQGARKSTACSVLAMRREWFSDDIRDLGTKDSAQDLRGVWIVEIAELSAMRRQETERVKAFIARSVDHYRPSYGRRSQDFPRGCVFIGTTNSEAYLADETGARRFWPARVGTIRLDDLRRDVEQLWAEAVIAYREGTLWHLSPQVEKHARGEQEKRRQVDPWEDAVLEYAWRGGEAVTIGDILTHALRVDLNRQDQACLNRVARILKAHDWERRQKRDGERRLWFYYPPGA